MSIKDTLTNNSMNSFSFGGKTYTRRVDNGAVVYDISAGTDAESGIDFYSGTFHGEDQNADDHVIIIPVPSNGKCGGVLELSDYSTNSNQDEGGMLSWNFDASTGEIKMQQCWSGGDGTYLKSNSVTATLTNTYQSIDISMPYQLVAWGARYLDGSLYLSSDAHIGVWQATVSSGGGGGGGSGTPAGSNGQLQLNDNGAFGSDPNLWLDSNGNLSVPRLAVGVGNFAGDEGGEIALRQSETNNTLVGNWVYMDVFQNRIRFFEDGSPYKGAYIDLTECADGVATNLLAGSGASVTTSASVPASPSDGDLWFNTTQAELYVYVNAQSAWIQTNGGGGSGRGNFSTGWVQTDDASNSVTNGATLTFNHNLGSADLLIEGYVSSTGSDSDAIQLTPMNRYGNTGMVGYKITGMTSSTVTIQLAGNGYGNPSSSGGLGNQGTNFSNEYIKFVISTGGGGAGPRAHVSFDGKNSNVNSTMTNIFNVSAITDTATGNYTVTFATPVVNPVVSATIASDETFAQNPHPKESKIAVFEKSSTSVQVRTGRSSYSAVDCPIDLLVF